MGSPSRRSSASSSLCRSLRFCSGRDPSSRPERVWAGGAPSLIANVFWVVLVGLWTAIGYVIEGALFCCTIVGIPFGLQLFKMAKLTLWPFGAEVR